MPLLSVKPSCNKSSGLSQVDRHGRAVGDGLNGSVAVGSRSTRSAAWIEGDSQIRVDGSGIGRSDEIRLSKQRPVVTEWNVDLGTKEHSLARWSLIGIKKRRQCFKGHVALAMTFGDTQPERCAGSVLPGASPIERSLTDWLKHDRYGTQKECAVAVVRDLSPDTDFLVAKLPANAATGLTQTGLVKVVLVQKIPGGCPDDSIIVSLKHAQSRETLRPAARLTETVKDLHGVVRVVD